MNSVMCFGKFVFAGFILWASRLQGANSQFPRACSTIEAIQSHECCPLLDGDGSVCGEEEERGFCSDIIIDDSEHGPPYALVGIDDRERWPERFFNR